MPRAIFLFVVDCSTEGDAAQQLELYQRASNFPGTFVVREFFDLDAPPSALNLTEPDDVTCDYCGAKVGELCTNARSRSLDEPTSPLSSFHADRVRKARAIGR